MDSKDRDALERCLDIASRDPSRAEQLRGKLEDEPWQEVAMFACSIVQSAALNLRPWETAPAFADVIYPDGVRRDPEAGALQDKMLAAGMSMFDPEPMKILRAKQ